MVARVDVKAFKMSPRLCQYAAEATSCAEQNPFKWKHGSLTETKRLLPVSTFEPDFTRLQE